MPGPEGTRTRLLAILTVLAVIAALKLTKPVTLPLVVGVFLIVLVWPVQSRLERRLPRWAATTVTAIGLLLAAAAVAAALIWSAARLADLAPELVGQLHRLAEGVTLWAKERGLPAEGTERTEREILGRVAPLVGELASRTYAALGLLGLILAVLLLGLLEVHDFEAKLRRHLPSRMTDAVRETLGRIADKVRRFLLALTLTSALSGVATGLFVSAVGLDFALLWTFTTFVLNYIPTLGPALSILPPTLYALVQFDSFGPAAATFIGVGTIQFVMGNFVDPKIGGRVLRLSPVAVLLAIVFWGWMWGVLGAFVAVPLTAALVIVCRQFPGTRWLAALVADVREEAELPPMVEESVRAKP
jgi:predicted PurR-regulated permease PerM